MKNRAASSAMRRLVAVAAPVLPIAIAVALLALRTVTLVLAKVGHAGATLDDAYIHFQYARAIAEGHPLRFQADAPVTSGSTSLLWPLLLAPFWAIGARGEGLVWVAWVLSFAALGGLSWEALRLTEPLAGRTAAVGAAAMTLAFGGFTWCAASGMEVVPFAWAIARATRRASEWVEAPPLARSTRRALELVALALAASLFRPEGAVTAGLVAIALATRTRCGDWRERLLGAAAGVAAVAVPIVLWMATGSPRSTTSVAKLLPGNPYYPGPVLYAAVCDNLRLLCTTLLGGEVWAAEFLPHGGAPFAFAGLAAVAVLGARTGRPFRAAGVLLIALTMIAPCFYLTFLWNRLRYLWPFATGWIVGLACLARLGGAVAGSLRSRWRAATGLACGAFAGLFAAKLDGVMDDAAQSASGINRQQVALGRWAKENLPADARIGVNDTGAIAYFGEHPTFDIVGLTTRGEARYWVAGAASRFEHYEHLQRAHPDQLPTHFIVYPEWMALGAVLGAELHEATVTDSTILGGRTMRVYAADWSALGTGERPWTESLTPEVDALDVADLESEAEHSYELVGARDGEQVVQKGLSPTLALLVDGGRGQRTLERFEAHLPAGVPARAIVRMAGPAGGMVRAVVDGEVVAELPLEDEGWVERSFEIPARSRPTSRIELVADDAPITVFHYWFFSSR